jgi:hypothetical protein
MANDYRYSYSGSDTRAYAWFPQMPAAVNTLESMHTISISVHEAKGQARALGFRGIKGLARGIRTIAGSIIFTVIEDHPMRTMMDTQQSMYDDGIRVPGWSVDFALGRGAANDVLALATSNRLCTLLSGMNILLQYVSEGSKFNETLSDLEDGKITNVNFSAEGAAALLTGVEFVGEGLVTSINDVVSEVTLSFIATDYKVLAGQKVTGNLLLNANELDERTAELYEKLMTSTKGPYRPDGGGEAYLRNRETKRDTS